MTTEEFRQLCDLAKDRDQKHYAWIRQLLLLSSGALTALVAFRADAHSTGIALWFLRVAWVTLGLSILLGALAMHGEVWTARELARLAGEQAKERFSSGETGIAPIVSMRHPRYERAEKWFYRLLILSVSALVVHAVVRQ
jgi:hypothetical protein